MPSSPNSATQNWWVDQRFRTRGMPTRSLLRDDDLGLSRGDEAEGVLANHLGNVRVATLDLLELGFHNAQLGHVLHQALGARVAADDALVAGGERQLAPRPPGRAGQLHVDERPRAVDRAPLAHG